MRSQLSNAVVAAGVTAAEEAESGPIASVIDGNTLLGLGAYRMAATLENYNY